MNAKVKIISLLVIPILFFSFTALANDTNIPINEHDSIYRYNALENKKSFFINTDDIGADTSSVEKIQKDNIVVTDDIQKLKNITNKQNDSLEKSNKAMTAIENRGNFEAFMIGNKLGVLKYQLAQMKDYKYTLNILALNTEDLTIKNQINDQLSASQLQQSKIEGFIIEQENRFNLFGWFINSF